GSHAHRHDLAVRVLHRRVGPRRGRHLHRTCRPRGAGPGGVPAMTQYNPALRRSIAVTEAVLEGRLSDLQMGILTACEHAVEDGIPFTSAGFSPANQADCTP